MYQQIPTDNSFVTIGGGHRTPIATLADQYGGRAQIAIDDHCYVLFLRQESGQYKAVYHWWEEVIKLIQTMPTPYEYEKEYERFLSREW